MAIRFLPANSSDSRIKGSPASSPKAQGAFSPKPASLRGFSALTGGQHCPPHCPPPRGAFPGRPGASGWPPGAPSCEQGAAARASKLGSPLDIRAVALLIGCSPWTVRQTLIPRGLPHFRFKASGRLTFYEAQVIRWIENQQGGKTTK